MSELFIISIKLVGVLRTFMCVDNNALNNKEESELLILYNVSLVVVELSII